MHPRIFYKQALSQQEAGYEVSIIARDQSEESYQVQGVNIIPIPSFERISSERLKVKNRITELAKQCNPDIIIIHTIELIEIGRKLKKLLGCKVIYDVHEDYYENIRHAGAGNFIRNLLIKWLRKREIKVAQGLDGVWYAELCYFNILKVPKNKILILKNTFSDKAAKASSEIKIPDRPYMLYTGTLAEGWGVFDTLKLWQKMHEIKPIMLLMAGHTHDTEFVEKIYNQVRNIGLDEDFQLVGGRDFVPYSDIVKLIQHCEFGTALYHTYPHISPKIPTKFYEYMAAGKALVFTDSPYWNELNAELKFGIPYQKEYSIEEIFQIVENYKTPIPRKSTDYSWQVDEAKMLKFLSEL